MRPLSPAQQERLRAEVPGQQTLPMASDAWVPPLLRIECWSCGDADFGPWLPVDRWPHLRYICEGCWHEGARG